MSNMSPKLLIKTLLAVAACAQAPGCASVKTMSEDFQKKWDDPKSILAEMDATAEKNRAAASSAQAMAAKNADECLSKFGLVGQSNPGAMTLSERQIGAGECFLERGKNADAAKIFQTAADGGGGAKALQGVGVAHARLGSHEPGYLALTEAVKLDPTLWRAWNALGVAADGLGKTEEALAAFRQAATLAPDDGAPLNNLGVALLKAGKHDEAIIALKDAISRDGAKEAAEANLRLTYAMAGDYDDAVRALPESRRAAALNNAGVAAATRGDKDEARRLFLKALEESPHFYARAYNNLSLLLD